MQCCQTLLFFFFLPGCKKAIGTQHYVLKCFLCHLFHCSSTLIYLSIGRGRAEHSFLALLWHEIIFCDLRRGLKEVLNQGPIKVSYLCVPSQFLTINLYLKVCVCFFFPFVLTLQQTQSKGTGWNSHTTSTGTAAEEGPGPSLLLCFKTEQFLWCQWFSKAGFSQENKAHIFIPRQHWWRSPRGMEEWWSQLSLACGSKASSKLLPPLNWPGLGKLREAQEFGTAFSPK